MTLAAAYAPPLPASIWPAALKRTMTARSANPAAAPTDSPVTPSNPVPFGVASNCAVKDPVWAVNALFCHVSELALHPGGSPCTVTVALPLCPSLVAVIVAEPAAAPVTTPLVLTVATEVLLLDQDTARPDSGVPFASFGVAVSCTVPPTKTDAVAGLTLTDATATFATVMLAVPLCPSLVAVIAAEPTAPPVTKPLPLTVATDVLLLVHVTVRPDSGLPLPSFGVAVSCTVAPTKTDPVAGLTLTDATGTLVTVMPALPLFPSLVAVITAEPVANAVTSPLASTLATLDWLVDQSTARPESALPAKSSGVAVSCTICPTCVVPEGGVTTTWATGVPVSTDLGSSQDWMASVTATVVAKRATRRRCSV